VLPGTASGSLTRRTWLPGALAVGLAAVSVAAMAGCGQVSSSGPAGQHRSASPTVVTSSTATASPSTAASPSAASGSTVPAQLELCADPVAVSRVQIVRIASIAQLPAGKGQPKPVKITVTNPARVRVLARAVCQLPLLPRGMFHCPIDVGGAYELIFSIGDRRLPLVQAAVSGCEMVTGAGPTRWAVRTPGFWTVLGQVAGIRAVAHQP